MVPESCPPAPCSAAAGGPVGGAETPHDPAAQAAAAATAAAGGPLADVETPRPPEECQECSICLAPVDERTEPHSRPHEASACRHTFHWSCIQRALEVQPLCPNCRCSYAEHGVYEVDPATGTKTLRVPCVPADGGAAAVAAPMRVADNPRVLEALPGRAGDGWSTTACGVFDLMIDSLDPHGCTIVRVCLCPGLAVRTNWQRADLGRFRALVGVLVSLCLAGACFGLALPTLTGDGCPFRLPHALALAVANGDEEEEEASCSWSAFGLGLFTFSWTVFVCTLFWVRWRIQRRFGLGAWPGLWSFTLLCCGCYACTLTQEARHIKWELEGEGPPRPQMMMSPEWDGARQRRPGEDEGEDEDEDGSAAAAAAGAAAAEALP